MNNFKITKNSIRWVIALKEEAQVILDHYKLKLVNKKTLYPIYKNEEESHWLIISNGAKKRDNEEIYFKFRKKLNYWLLELDKFKNE